MNPAPRKHKKVSFPQKKKTRTGGRRKRVDARFQLGDRVAWTSGKEWKCGTVMGAGLSKEEALKSIPPGYTLTYKSSKTTTGRIYLVAADLGMLKPGYHLHSVKESRLRHEHESWIHRLETLQALPASQILALTTQLLRYTHDRGGRAAKEVRAIFESVLKTTF
jgi:hypothetical protein